MAGKTTWSRSRALRFAATTMLVAVTITLLAGVVPTVVAAEAAIETPVFQSRLGADATTGKLTASTDQPLAATSALRARTATVIVPVVTQTATRRTSTSGSTSTASNTSTAGNTNAAAAEPVAAAAVDETAEARAILAGYIAQYPILAGSSVSIGDAKGNQAIAYYTSGRIVISPTHTASLTRIIGHEIWHIIDYRDNGVIDWGENVPPN